MRKEGICVLAGSCRDACVHVVHVGVSNAAFVGGLEINLLGYNIGSQGFGDLALISKVTSERKLIKGASWLSA